MSQFDFYDLECFQIVTQAVKVDRVNPIKPIGKKIINLLTYLKVTAITTTARVLLVHMETFKYLKEYPFRKSSKG